MKKQDKQPAAEQLQENNTQDNTMPMDTDITQETTPELTPADVEKLAEEAGYPDISKANTKMVVIISLVVVLLVLLLSILFPSSITRTPATQQNTEVTNTTSETTTEALSNETSTEESTTETTPELLDMSQIETSTTWEVFSMPDFPSPQSGFQEINGQIYYLVEGEVPFTGWLEIDNICYYIDNNGIISTGWKDIDGVSYYFDQHGRMVTNQWIDGKYLGTQGNMYRNTITPDGIYVGKDGTEDSSLGKVNSVSGLKDLEVSLNQLLEGYSGTWSVYVKDIENKEYLSINNTQMFSASLIKLYCGAAAFDLMDKGTMEETEGINSLMYQMISISDNDAFSLMVTACSGVNSQIAGRPVIQKYIDAEGYVDTTLTSMLLPTKYKATSSPGRNYTTVEDCGLLLEKIYKGKCVNPEVSRKFLDLLFQQTHVNKIVAGLPEGTRCANKTGDTDEFQHDVAIVYSPGGDYIIAVMSSDSGAAINNIRTISETVYNYFN